MKIKQVDLADLYIIKELAYEIWPTAYATILRDEQLHYMLSSMYSISSLQHQIKILHHHFFLIIENGTPIGFASYSNISEIDSNKFKLHKLYLLPEFQKKGIGRTLMQFIFNHILTLEMKDVTITLNVNRDNSALQFYQHIGFHITREEDIDIGGGFFMNDYVLEKRIKYESKDSSQ